MSQKARVRKLEEQKAGGFCVVVPHELDSFGEAFDASPQKSEVQAVRFSDGNRSFQVERLAKENYDDFEARATALAKEEFGTPIVLPFYTHWI